MSIKKDFQIFLLIFCILFAQFQSPDFFNYQYYNGWAFLNNRLGTDFYAATFRSYFNPYLDTLLYLFIQILNNHPVIYTFLAETDTAFALFMVYKIADKILDIKTPKNIIILTMLYVVVSPLFFELFESTRVDMIIADIVLLAFYTLLKDNGEKSYPVVIAGFLTGLAAVLKITAVVYGLTFPLCLLILRKPIKKVWLFIISALISFFVIDGYWLYTLFKHFGNPFFPFLNNIFNSQYADLKLLADNARNHIHPNTVWQFVFYPFLFSKDFCYGSDRLVFDGRYAINALCLIILFFFVFCKNKISDITKDKREIVFLISFVFISYTVNTALFGVYRYIYGTVILYGIILYLTLSFIFKEKKRDIIFIILTIVVSAVDLTPQALQYTSRVKFKENDKIVQNQDLHIKDNSTVIPLNFGTSGFIVNQNKNAKYVGFVYPKHIYDVIQKKLPKEEALYFGSTYYYNSYMEDLLKNIMQDDGDIYIVFTDEHYKRKSGIYKPALGYYSKHTRTLKNCKKFKNNFNHGVICEYNKIYNL